MNPFYNKPTMINGGVNYMGNIQQVYKMLMNSKNPTQMFMQMAQTNPQLRPIAQALQSGNNPQEVFKMMCQQRGINPDEFIKSITGNNTDSR